MDKYYWKNGGSRSAVLGLEVERRSAYQSSDGRREREKNCPSFSSSLLDQIYRSMDREEEEADDALVLYRETAGRKPIKKQYYSYPTTPSTTTSSSWKKEQLQDYAVGNYSLGRIEKWMEKKKSTSSTTNQNKIIILNHHHHHHRNSTSAAAAAAEYYPRRKPAAENGDQYSSCCRSSSGSSSGDYLFSSSEAESTTKTTSSSSFAKYRPKPIRAGISTVHRFSSSICTTNHDQQPQKHVKQTSRSTAAGTSIFRNQEMKLLVKKISDRKHQQSSKTNNSGDHFSKTKSKALKIYADLKKVKQPLSPGGKLASFFTSIFNKNNNYAHNNNITNNNAKKAKKAKMTLVSSNEEEEEVISKFKYSAHHHHHASTCSSASSFSRTTSCLSKSSPPTTSTCKRSVRFYPLTTDIVDGKDCLQTATAAAAAQRDKRNNNNDPGIRENGEEVARDLFKSSYHKRSAEFKNTIMDINHEEKDDDDYDAASCASSDLFELDNLNYHHAFERYGEELPVYETTYFDTNRAIANGLIM